MSNEIATLDQLQTMANAVAKCGLFGMKTQEQALALMLIAQAEGQHPATITQDYDIIQGKAARKTHSVLARFQQAGGKVQWTQLTDAIAEATFSHPAGGELTIAWTFEQAKRAGLTNKDNWKNYPRAMLRARCIAEGVRAVFPAAIGGMMVSEEAQDMPAMRATVERDMGAATVVPDAVDVPAVLAEIETINDIEVLRTRKAEWNAACVKSNDVPAWNTIKGAAAVRAEELAAPVSQENAA